MVHQPDSDLPAADTWVTVTEAAEKTGYNRSYMQRLARNNWNLPEDQREIKVRKALFGYLIWLPDVTDYIAALGRGPHQKTD